MKKKLFFLAFLICVFFAFLTLSASALTLPTSDQGCYFCKQTWSNYEKDIHCDAVCECTFEQCPFCGENTILIYCGQAHLRFYNAGSLPTSDFTVACSYCNVPVTVSKTTFRSHSHSIYSRTVSPTCISYGYKEYYCNEAEKCVFNTGYLSLKTSGSRINFTEPIDEHDLSFVQNVPTSCSGYGYDEYVCNICSLSFHLNIVPALDHTPIDGGVYNPSSCVYKGYTLHTCAVCSVKYKVDFVDALGHVYDFNCTLRSDGSIRCTDTCSRCLYSVERLDYCTNFSPTLYSCDCGLGADASWNGAEFSRRIDNRIYFEDFCNDCGTYIEFFVDEIHELRVEIIDGVAYDNCSSCDYSVIKENYDPDNPDPPNGDVSCVHEFVTTVVAPTCQIRGFTFIECVKCNYSEAVDFVDPVAHSYIAVGRKEPTCVSAGMIQYACVYCDVLSGDGYLAPLGHEWKVVSSVPSDDGMITTHLQCDRCHESKTENFPTQAAQAQNWFLTCIGGLFEGFTNMYDILANGIEIGNVTLGMVVTACLIVIVIVVVLALCFKILG